MEGMHYPKASRAEIEKLLEDTKNQSGNRSPDKKPLTFGRVLGKILSTLVLLVLAGILTMLLVTKMQGGSPNLFGYRIFIVETGSMEPTLPIGTAIIVRELQPGQVLNEGDVVTYTHEGATITHRVVEVGVEDGHPVYHTKGDNPINSVDPWTITLEDVVGTLKFHVKLPSFTSGGGNQ